ncbi:ATP-binding cassette domain-containing protein [Clostridium celatum]|uniref:ATP-binding cassette domain-containing protein n=1 Tax=Clostridium celatum TaxID=36834 RepID=UPI0028FE1F3A|nr:ATP-binding cassette domain-containing protein [Clostridium celatum]MDU2169473.1 ATP-binding cassette domain-containing protein [Clostridium perfringens]MDU2266908.1 ATP-binding cassette domain-containing protein [Clostridium celatum]MDU6297452.1 ATP-binding cassette domain-containing protein [Clostridium celatum]
MRIENININYGNDIVYENFSIELKDNKINCIIGSSGCGKTTLLNYIANELLQKGIKVSYIFQNDNLIPWKNVYSNLKLIAKNNIKEDQVEIEIDKILEEVGLKEFKYYYPNELSGGMKQRVNIARALLGTFDVILMDEPFKSLDIKCKSNIISIIKDLNIKKGITIIMVTHDKEEILNLADNLFLLGNRPVQILESSKLGDFKNIIEKL